MQIEDTLPTLVPTREGILFLSGFATSLRVERRHLVVRTGAGRHIRSGRFSKVQRPRLRRVVVHGIGGGSATWQALAWLDGIGASLVHLSWDGEVIATSARAGADDPGLRRAQARAAESPIGVAIAKYLIAAKVGGQLSVLENKLKATTAQTAEIRRCLQALDAAEALTQVRLLESKAASAYWSVWSQVPIRFGKPSVSIVPSHWGTFGSRSSPLSSGTRLAAGPGNALMNYLYAIGEAEARLALHAVGLDPGLGILHVDQWSRDSLALDLLEVVRPQIDAYVLDQLRTRTFSHKDFVELPNGNCRLSRSIVERLVESAPAWRTALGPFAEYIAKALGRSSRRVGAMPTPLTQTNRSQSRDGIRKAAVRPKQSKARRLPFACHSCGVIFEGASRDRDLCDDCLLDDRRRRAAGFTAAGQEAAWRRKTREEDPSHSPEARARLGRANARRVAEMTAWGRAHPEESDPEYFRREILPSMRDVPLSQLARATGLSIQYCSQVGRGLFVPHPRHWQGFLRAVASTRTR